MLDSIGSDRPDGRQIRNCQAWNLAFLIYIQANTCYFTNIGRLMPVTIGSAPPSSRRYQFSSAGFPLGACVKTQKRPTFAGVGRFFCAHDIASLHLEHQLRALAVRSGRALLERG